MANISITNGVLSSIEEVLDAVATQGVNATTTTSSSASYSIVLNGGGIAQGIGFTYDVTGKLIGGTINELQHIRSFAGSSGIGRGLNIRVSGLSLPVQQAIVLASAPDGALPVLLAGTNTVNANSTSVTLYAGDDTIAISEAFNTVRGGFATTATVDGGGGVDAAVFSRLRDGVRITGGGDARTVVGNEVSASFGVTFNLLAVEELRFIDGAVYESAAAPGAQAALIFLGILGRLPDPINAGGFGLLAQQSGTTAAADRLLATVEGQARTATLDNAGYVSRLYGNVLRRVPEAAEVAGWQQALDSGVVTRAGTVALFASSPEARAVNAATFAAGSVFGASPNAVSALRVYQTVLNRPVEAASLLPIVEQLNSGATTLAILEDTAVTSPEFRSLLGGATDNASFVGLLQRNVYGAADQATTEFWSSLLDRGRVTRGSVADAFAFSPGADAKIAPLVTNQGIVHL